jgi:CheY-like chemotaxis protein
MNILIVEDELLIALDLESIVEDLGHKVIGPARTLDEALQLAGDAEVALVDVQLADGVTGPAIAERLSSEHGVTVVFVTGNPEMVRNSRGAIGVVSNRIGRRRFPKLWIMRPPCGSAWLISTPRFLMPLVTQQAAE